MTYPATTLEEAVTLTTIASNQLHDVINGDENTQIQVEDGSYIPSVRKAMKDGITSSVFGGQYRNLKITVSGVGYQGAITVDRLIVEDSLGQTKLLKDISLSFNAANTGTNGLDTGVISTNTWYYTYVIYNPNTTTTASLISLSPTDPVLPTGYGMYTRVGSAYALASSFRPSTKNGRYVLWGVGTTMNAVQLVSSLYNTAVTPFSTLTAQPPTSNVISVRFVFPTGSTGWAELNIDQFRTIPIIYINQTEQAFCADIPTLITNTLYYITSGESAKVIISVYGYEDSV